MLRSMITSLALALSISFAAQAAEPPLDLTAARLLPLADPRGGSASLVTPPPEKFQNRKSEVLLFKPTPDDPVLTLRLPVPNDGYYRIQTHLVFGPWREGPYGMYRAKADGVELDGYFHGWYGRGPGYLLGLQEKNWGAVFLRKPSVDLSFHLDTKQAGDLLAIERVRLEPAEAAKLTDADRARRVPERAKAEQTPARRIEDPTHTVRAQLQPADDPKNAIPQRPVTRQTYLDWCDRSGHIERDLKSRDHGPYGPRHALPSLAKFVATGERRYGESVKEMLRAFAKWLDAEVKKTGMNSQYMHEPTLIGIELRFLRKGGLIAPEDEAWIKEMILLLNRTVHVWGTPETHWRGAMHRAQGEGVMKWLAAQWYPDAPEAKAWKDYAQTVWDDFWPYRDIPPNDTGYSFGVLFPLVLGPELMEKTPSGQTPKEFFNDPEMKKIWERLMFTVSPDGAVIPYGAHGGWGSTAGERIWMLELAARYTRDGRYRFAAHRLMNYLIYQEAPLRTHHILDGPYSTEQIALAYLFANESIAPVQPDARSMILTHREVLRVNGKKGAAAYLRNLDPAPDRAQICCGLICTARELPFKLIFRSGWRPGDLFMLVDLFPRHEPLNVSGIAGLVRFAVAFTQAFPSKRLTDFLNMLMVEDLSGTATAVTNPNPNTIDAYYQDVEVPEFSDHALATHAVVRVKDYTGFPMTNQREIFFIKNRFVVVKDVAEFRERFLTRLGPTWQTQRITAAGPNWLNTYMAAPLAAEKTNLLHPSYDLLVFHAPQADRRLDVAEIAKPGESYAYAPLRTRYVWQGIVEPGKPVAFTQILLPHSPLQPAAELAAGIKVRLDTPEQTALCVAAEKGREEWIVLNAAGSPLKADTLETDAKQLYLDLREGQLARALMIGGSFLARAGKDLHRQPGRGVWEK